MKKTGLNVEYIGKAYNPKALSKGCAFAIKMSKKDKSDEWQSVWINVYTPVNIVIDSKDTVKFSGFGTLEESWKDRPAQFKIVAMDISVIEKDSSVVVDNRRTPANTATQQSEQPAKTDYGF